ncbi:AAA family ATPase [Catenulispora yoronensis]
MDRVRSAIDAKGARSKNVGGNIRCQGLCHDGDSDDIVSVQYDQAAGKVRMRCFKHCPDEEVIAAYGLTWADLYDKPHAKSRGAAREHTYERRGRVIGVNSRTRDRDGGKKDFLPLTPTGDGWVLKSNDELKSALYNWDAVDKALADNVEIWVTAGEHDADSLNRGGLVATTNFGAELAWKQCHADALKGARISIVLDNDDTGSRRLPLLAQTLTAAGATFRTFRPCDGFKDVTDMLTAGHDLTSLVPVKSPMPAEDEETAAQREFDKRLLEGARDGAWLDQQNFPPLKYAVEGLIPEGFSLLVGPPKAGKSWLILGVLLAVSSPGGYALGTISTGDARRVLYLALEDGDRRMQDRCRTVLGGGVEIPPLFHYMTRILPGTAIATIEAFLRLYPDTSFVVVDTLGKVLPPAMQGESAYQRDYRIGGDLKRIADDHPGLAIVVPHHDRKAGSEDFVDSVSGTNGLAGAADTIVVLARARQSTDGLLMVTGRDVEESEYALTMVDAVWTLDGTDLAAAAKNAVARRESGTISDRTAEILAFVRDHGDGIGAADVAEGVGIDQDQARVYLNRLEKADKIAKYKRGVYGPIATTPTSNRVSSVSTVTSAGAKTSTTKQRNANNTVGGAPLKLVPDLGPNLGDDPDEIGDL